MKVSIRVYTKHKKYFISIHDFSRVHTSVHWPIFYDMETFIKQSSRLQKLGGDPDKTHLESPLHTIEDKRSQIV